MSSHKLFHCSWWHLWSSHCICTACPPFKAVFTTWVYGHWKCPQASPSWRCVFQADIFYLKINHRMHFGEHRSRNGTLTEDSQTTNMSSQSSSQCCHTDWKNNIISSKSIVLSITFSHYPCEHTFWTYMWREAPCASYRGDLNPLPYFSL